MEPQPVTLATANYNLASPNTPATATISDSTLPTVAIETQFERVSDTDYVKYTLSAESSVNFDINVSLSIDSDEDSVVDSINSDPLTVNLTNLTPTITQQIQFNSGVANNSLVEMSVTSIRTYMIDPAKADISFRVDNGTNFPAVAISGDGPVSEGRFAVYTVSTNELDQSRTSDLEVAISVSENATNFIIGTHQPTVTIPAGSTSAKYNVPTAGDTIAGDTDGIITAEIEPGANYKRANRNTSSTVTVLNDGTFVLPSIEFALANQEVQEGTGTKVVPSIVVNMSHITGQIAMVQYTLNEGSATEPEDYMLTTGATGTLSFYPGETTKSIPLEIIPDQYDEDNENFTVTLSSPTHTTLGTNDTNTVTIVDDDLPPVASIISTYSAAEGSGANDANGLVVSLTAASARTVKVGYVFNDDTAENNADFAGEIIL